MNYRERLRSNMRAMLAMALVSLVLYAEGALGAPSNFADSVSEQLNAFSSIPGVTVNSGESRINGAAVAMKAISSTMSSEELAKQLRKIIGKTAYVAVHHTEYSDVIVVTPKDVLNKEESVFQSYVISVMNLPSGARLGMGSSAGALLQAQLRSPKLESTWLNQSRKLLQPAGSSVYSFAETQSLQELAHCDESIARCRMAVVSDLRGEGYFPINPDEKVDSESNAVLASPDKEYSGVWRRGQTTIYLNITKKGPGAPSEVGIYEVTAK